MQHLIDPKGLDRIAIDFFNRRLDTITWLTTYGKAIILETANLDGDRRYSGVGKYPAIYLGEGLEYLSVFPDELIAPNYSFLLFEDGVDYEFGRMKGNGSVVVFYNIEKIYPSTFESKSHENIKAEVHAALISSGGDRSITSLTFYEDADSVYREFQHNNIIRQFRKRPYGCLRIDFEYNFPQEC